MKCVLRSLILALMYLALGTPSIAQFPGNSDLADDSYLLRRGDVQKELELIDEQIEELTSRDLHFQQRHKKLRASHAKAVIDGGIEEKLLDKERKVWETFQLLNDIQQGQYKLRQEVLLPHQLQRLQEIRWQYRVLGDPVATFDQVFNLKYGQISQMRKKEQGLRKDLIDKLWAFHRESQKKILEPLTPEQAAQWNEAIGEEFKFQSSRPGLQLFQSLR